MALGSKQKNWIKKALVTTGALGLATRLAKPSAVVLMYHSVVENPQLTENSIGISQSRSDFEAHIRTLAHRFTPVTLEQIVEFANGGRELPVKSVAVTFDDGFLDNYEVALPILNHYGVPATFYIMVDAVATGMLPWYCRLNFAFRTTLRREWTDTEHSRSFEIQTLQDRKAGLHAAWAAGARKTGAVQAEFVRQIEESLDVEPLTAKNRLMLTWDQVRALKRAGHVIGGHTLSHPNLAHVTKQEAQSEIVGCKGEIEKELDAPVDHFSYPHPALDPQSTEHTLQVTREAGFRSAVLTACGPVRRGDEPLGLKRIYAANGLDQWIWNLQSTFLGRSV
jgi:peptidoglycan/xylan/chitin deacetylase (PgdA/CDA1 family)